MCREAAAATIQRRLVIQIPTKPLRASWSLVGPKTKVGRQRELSAADKKRPNPSCALAFADYVWIRSAAMKAAIMQDAVPISSGPPDHEE